MFHRTCSFCYHFTEGLTGVVTTIASFPEPRLTTAMEVVAGTLTTALGAVTSKPSGIGQFIKSTKDAAVVESAAVDVR